MTRRIVHGARALGDTRRVHCAAHFPAGRVRGSWRPDATFSQPLSCSRTCFDRNGDGSVSTRASSAIARTAPWLRLCCVLGLLGCISVPFYAQSHGFGQPAEHLAASNRVAFDRGLALFRTQFTASTGLGPEFNAVSCASCHRAPAIGGSGGNAWRSLVDWRYTDASDVLGGPRQRFSLAATRNPAAVQPGARSRRRTPPLFGLGQLEAVPAKELLSRSDPFDADGDGISGRLPWRDHCYGRFGWQSAACDVESFVVSALMHEIGIVSFPRSLREISRADVSDLVTYVRGLSPPPVPPDWPAGEELFERVLCAKCHTPVTGTATVGGALVQVRAYTDSLLHEMGAGRQDGEQDSRTEFRTPALWGVAQMGPYLHDASAATLNEAIVRHGGEAAESRRRFSHLDSDRRQQLLRFVATR